jgi:hypothetical protein
MSKRPSQPEPFYKRVARELNEQERRIFRAQMLWTVVAGVLWAVLSWTLFVILP